MTAEYFGVTIRNRNTRMAYLHAAGNFFAWCEHHQIGQLVDIEPLHVAAYIDTLKVIVAKKTDSHPKESRDADG